MQTHCAIKANLANFGETLMFDPALALPVKSLAKPLLSNRDLDSTIVYQNIAAYDCLHYIHQSHLRFLTHASNMRARSFTGRVQRVKGLICTKQYSIIKETIQ